MLKSRLLIWLSGLICTVILIAGIFLWSQFEQSEPVPKEAKLNAVEKKKARAEYFFRMLRDPAQNSIPDNIRSRELEHAKRLPVRRAGFLRKGQAGQQALDVSWQLAGPKELGGRTRALAVDQRDSDIILSGGVSGGIWKSTDGSSTWQMKTDPDQNMSVTSLAQDPTSPDTWYYASGEFLGSAGDQGDKASYFGTGIFKSTDNGESWSRISSTKDTDTDFNSNFDYISRIKVSPTTGSVFAASNYSGLLRSTDGSNFSIVEGGLNQHAWIDFDIDQHGNIIAVFSSEGSGGNPGIFYSLDDGDSWTEVTPSGFPSGHDRSVIAFAPSDTSIVYTFSEKVGSSTNQGASFFKIDITDLQNPVESDRSANLPDFGEPVGGVNLQGGYNMVVSVKLDNPDFVMIGATNLFRSQDGFATAPSGTGSSEKDKYWIGGYAKANDVSQYPGQHPDQHVIAYDPNDPKKVWSGHDGGLSLTTDITASAVDWDDKDEGYVTGQFYTVAIPSSNGDNRLLGGTQDNGTPYFKYDGSTQQQTSSILDVSSGDGAYGFWGTNYSYVSSQEGNVVRIGIESDGSLTSPYDGSTSTDWSYIYPSNASNQLFIHPYEIDPNDEGIMYYPDGNDMWRNTKVDDLSSGIQGGTTTDWNSFSAAGSGYLISTLEATNTNPSDRLYYAAYSSGSTPKIFSVDDASSSWSPTDISISGATSGAYIHDIAINPQDGDEVIAVMSNYGIMGLYHSTNGGSSWTAIEGNLEGRSSDPGPSLRNASILPTSSGTIYLLGTSTGVYSTTTLDGNSTTWIRESPDNIGYSVAEHIVSRPGDGKIAVGTHGRGIFVGQTNVGGTQLASVNMNISVGNNWKLVGSPMASKSGVTLGSDVTLFGFSGAYKPSSVMESQTGYWVKSRSGSQIEFSGNGYSEATISLDAGWNIIGGITDTVSVNSISDPNKIRSSTPIYEYANGSYQNASNIKSTEGYWVHVKQAGPLELSASGGSSGRNNLVSNSSGVSKVKFQSGTASQLFFVSPHTMKGEDREQFLMPPQAPEPMLDVRTSEGFRLADGKSTELELTTASYPVKVSMPGNISTDFVLKGITGKDTVYYDLSGEREVSIQQPHQKLLLEPGSASEQITKHNLFPNYPNPFNPATQIRYQVASQSNVQLQVFDVLGRRVRTLVNKQQQQGSYTVRFDGRNLSSGTYFIHLKAGNTTKLQKMTLIK